MVAASSPLSSGAHEPLRRQRRRHHSLGFLSLFYSYLSILLFLVTIACFTPGAEAALRNVTVDDELGDELTKVKPTFLPTAVGVWEGEECGGCRVKPDPALTFKNTYIAATYRKENGVDPVEFSFQFTGTAVYVFLTLANNAGDGITTLTETNFTIDDGTPTFFRHTPGTTTDYEYQFPAFVRENLEHRTHTLRARTSGPDYHIFINFDYAIYTYDDALVGGVVGTTPSPTTSSTTASSSTSTSSSSSSSSNNLAGPIAGGVVGGLAILAAFVIALLFIRRRTRHASALADSDYGGVVGVAGRGRRNEEKEYPDPGMFTSGRFHNTRYAQTEAGSTVYPPITPFMYAGSSHSLPAQTQGGGSSGDGSSGGVAPYMPPLYGAGRGSGRGRGGNTSPQPVTKHRIGNSGGGSSDNTGLSYITDVRTAAREPPLPVYTPHPQPNSNQPHLRSQSNQDALSMGSGSGSSMSGNPYAGIEDSVYAATGVRLDAMQPRTYFALNAQASNPSLSTGNKSPPQATQPSYSPSPTNLDTQMHALQESIRILIANLHSEREALRARGVANDAIQRDGGLEKMTETLRRMAEEMSALQDIRRGMPEGGENGGESRRTTTTQPPGYESGLLASRE